MSSAIISASRLKPEIRLAQAVSEFEAALSSNQKSSFRTYRTQARDAPPDASDVMRLTAELDSRAAGRGGRVRCFGPRLTNFLHACHQFAALGDIIVGGSQNLIACGVWSVVRISLQVIVNFSSYLEKLSAILMNVGRSSPRYQMMALLYPRSKNLQSHLSEYFIVVVRLCHQLLNFTQKSVFGQLASSLSDSEMKNYQSELDLWANSIKEEVNLLMAKKIVDEAENNSHFRSMFSKSVSLQQTIKTNLRLLNVCSTYDYETTWKQTRKVGNATLFNQNAEYQDWRSRVDSCTLIYTGKLGSGKSVLLANIVDNLHLYSQGKNTVVAYFFCRHDISKSLKAQTVIGSLARQLLRLIPDLAMAKNLLDETSPALDFEKIFSFLKKTLPNNYKAYFILDGLDECDHAERELLIQQLKNLQGIFTLLLCVSLRQEPNNASNLGYELFEAPIYTSIPDDNPDIEAFIGAELESCIESQKLVIGNPDLILEIQDTLLEKSQGMFLWVVLQIESLCTMKTDDAIRGALADLPKDLSETFSRILQKSEELGKPYQRLILELVTAARRPLTTEELQEALSVVPGDAVWDPAKRLNRIYSTLACCGSLVTVDEEELTIRLVHHSVKQFLLGGFKDSSNIAFTIDSAKRTMADIIITYLNYGVFETQLSTVVVPQIMVGSVPSRVINSTLDSSSRVRSLALELLKSRKRPEYDIGQTLAESSKLFNHSLASEFHFYAYAKSYWLQHVNYVSEKEPVMHNLLLRLFKSKVVYIDATDGDDQKPLVWAASNGHEEIFRLLIETWKFDVDSKHGDDGQTLLSRAAINGHGAVVKMLLEKGAKLETKDRDGLTPLSRAAMGGHEAVVRLLLENGAETETRNIYHQTPLSWAAMNGHKAAVKVLVEKGAELETTDIYWETPLFGAARNGHEDVVKLLLENGTELETKSENGRTPFSEAAENGHDAVLKLLVEKGAELETESLYGQTPLSYAAENGHEMVVKFLLDEGAELETKDEIGQTPLWWAARRGHEAVVKLLLEKGAELEAKEKYGQTPLSCAAANGHIEVVKMLLEKGAELETKSDDGQTPLSWAAKNGHEAVVKLLLDKGAALGVKDKSGHTPLQWATIGKHEMILKLPLEKRAELETKGRKSRTVLSWAAANGREAMVRLLLEKNAELGTKSINSLIVATEYGHEAEIKLLLETKDKNGQTPLSQAAEKGHEAVVELLLEKGAELEIKDKRGHTALSWAALNGHEVIVKLLLEKGAELEPKSINNQTPLSGTARYGHEAVVKLLLEKGAELETKSINGETPLSWAAKNGHKEVVKVLLEKGAELETKSENGFTPLRWAVKNGHEAVVKLLLEKGAKNPK